MRRADVLVWSLWKCSSEPVCLRYTGMHIPSHLQDNTVFSSRLFHGPAKMQSRSGRTHPSLVPKTGPVSVMTCGHEKFGPGMPKVRLEGGGLAVVLGVTQGPARAPRCEMTGLAPAGLPTRSVGPDGEAGAGLAGQGAREVAGPRSAGGPAEPERPRAQPLPASSRSGCRPPMRPSVPRALSRVSSSGSRTPGCKLAMHHHSQGRFTAIKTLERFDREATPGSREAGQS